MQVIVHDTPDAVAAARARAPCEIDVKKHQLTKGPAYGASANLKSEICNLKSEIKNRRRGWTLMELIIVCAVMTLLLAIVASVTHTMYRSQRSTRDDITSRRILTRLSLQLRDDVHAAGSAEVDPAGGDETVRLTLEHSPQQTIEYIVHDDRGAAFCLPHPTDRIDGELLGQFALAFLGVIWPHGPASEN